MTINAPDSPETQSLPLGPYPRIVTHAFDVPGIDQLEVYRAHGGYEALAKALRDIPAGRAGRGGQGVGPARARRRGLPDRREVGLRAQGARTATLSVRATPTRASRAPSRTA